MTKKQNSALAVKHECSGLFRSTERRGRGRGWVYTASSRAVPKRARLYSAFRPRCQGLLPDRGIMYMRVFVYYYIGIYVFIRV